MSLSLRERKKRHIREAIQREALRLITAQGYDATTCEQIAASAGVSAATLFRYFPTKEDIVLTDDYDPLIGETVRGRPGDERPLAAVRAGLATALAQVPPAESEVVRQRTSLILSVPALRSRSREQQESLASHLVTALRARGGSPSTPDVEVVAAACATAITIAVQRWAEQGGALSGHVDTALAALAHLGEDAAGPPGPPT